jgi:hypothetical protein
LIGNRNKKPAADFPARADFCDAEYMPVICPTRQARRSNSRVQGVEPMHPSRIVA